MTVSIVIMQVTVSVFFVIMQVTVSVSIVIMQVTVSVSIVIMQVLFSQSGLVWRFSGVNKWLCFGQKFLRLVSTEASKRNAFIEIMLTWSVCLFILTCFRLCCFTLEVAN